MGIPLSTIHAIQSTRYSQLASGTIIIYDHLVTLGDEVELIWKSGWTYGKVVFLLNRYYGLISVIINNYGLFSPLLTNSFCLHFFQWQGWTGLIACVIAEVILQMRLSAMYYSKKKILALMIISFIIATAASAAIMGFVLSKIKAIAIVPLIPGLNSCLPTNIDVHFYAFWIPMLAFESLLCALALYKAYEASSMPSSSLHSGNHLFRILIRDSVLYFVVLFTTYLTNFLIFLIASQTLIEIPIGFSVAMSCVMGNRIFLNVRNVPKDFESSQKLPGQWLHSSGRSRSIVSPSGQASLSDIEMKQLRSMKADIPIGI